ncbi:hypothetical protein, partial [Staphylococcus epidermidis]|uniref:hypothetical protein n=1 Tax=Staphylococcus epidermidis TaxID=1282 RepID=UPI001C92D82E
RLNGNGIDGEIWKLWGYVWDDGVYWVFVICVGIRDDKVGGMDYRWVEVVIKICIILIKIIVEKMYG